MCGKARGRRDPETSDLRQLVGAPREALARWSLWLTRGASRIGASQELSASEMGRQTDRQTASQNTGARRVARAEQPSSLSSPQAWHPPAARPSLHCLGAGCHQELKTAAMRCHALRGSSQAPSGPASKTTTDRPSTGNPLLRRLDASLQPLSFLCPFAPRTLPTAHPEPFFR